MLDPHSGCFQVTHSYISVSSLYCGKWSGGPQRPWNQAQPITGPALLLQASRLRSAEQDRVQKGRGDLDSCQGPALSLSDSAQLLPRFLLSVASCETEGKNFCFLVQAYMAHFCICTNFIISEFGEWMCFQISKRRWETQQMRSFPGFSSRYKTVHSAFIYSVTWGLNAPHNLLLINTAKEHLQSV